MKPFHPFLSLLLAQALAAQTNVCVSGTIVPVGGPTICQQGETHRLDGTAIYLRSSTVNLDSVSGRVVEVQGTDIGLLCRVIDVQAVVDPTPVALTWCGSPMIGCPLKVVVQGPGLGFAILAASLTPDFQPLGCGNNPGDVHGTLQLGQPVETIFAGVTTSGSVDTTIAIPLDNALVGLFVWFQGAHMTIGRQGPLRLSNVGMIQVSLLLPPCAPTNC